MKIRLFFILLLIPFVSEAQNTGTVFKTGATNQATIQKGGNGADSADVLPVIDTIRGKAYLSSGGSALRLKGRILLDANDSTKVYVYNGNKWQTVGGTTIDTNAYLKKTDTSRSGIVTTYFYVDSLYNTIGTHDSLVKYSDSLTNVYATGYDVDTLTTGVYDAIANIPPPSTPNWQATLDVAKDGDTAIINNSLYIGTTEYAKPVSFRVHGDSRAVPFANSPYFDTMYGWAQRVANYFGWKLRNSAVSGTTLMKRVTVDPFASPNMIDQLPYVKNVTGLTDSVYKVAIAYGTNDIRYNGANYTAANFSADFTTVLDTFIARGWTMSNILLIAPAYLSPTSYVSLGGNPAATQARHLEFVDTVAALAARYGTKFFNAYRWEQVRNGDNLFQVDSVHENISGHAVMFEGVVKAWGYDVKRDNQQLAVNGVSEFNNIKFRLTDTTDSIGGLVGIDNYGNGVITTNSVIQNNHTQYKQGADFNINGVGTMQQSNTVGRNVSGQMIVNGQFINGTSFTPPALSIGLANSLTDYAIQHYRTTSTYGDLYLNPFGGTVEIGTGPLVPVSAGQTLGINGGTISKGFNTYGLTTVTTTPCYTFGYSAGLGAAFIYPQNSTLPLSLNFGGEPVMINSYTPNGTTDKLQVTGNVALQTAGNKLRIKSGTNASVGTATLVGGTVTVNTTAVTANSIVIYNRATTGGTVGNLSYTKVANTSITFNSDSGTETSTIDYIIIDAF